MPTDRYTKGVLTAIAVALVWIAGQQIFSTATAQTGTCGVTTPCLVVSVHPDQPSSSWASTAWVPCYAGKRPCYAVATAR
jgi:hypothetical protein